MNKGTVTFSKGVIADPGLVYISAQVTELNDRDSGHTKVLQWMDGQFDHFMISWPTTAMTVSSEPLTLFSMGLDGDIHVFADDRQHEVIKGPQFKGPLRDMRLIAGVNYSAGMQRQVYRRRGPDDWVSISDSILNTEGIKGFNSLDGYAHDEIYAAGLAGEVWRFDGQQWLAIDAPTSIALQRVLCADNGQVYIVGLAGTILVGRHEQWDVLDTDDSIEDFWGVEWFNGHLYVSSSKVVYKVVGDQFIPQPIGSTGQGSASFLQAGHGMLWSIGNRHLAYTHDGDTWTAVDYDDAAY